MALRLADLAVIAVLVAIAAALSYAGLRRALRRTVFEQQQATERRLNEFALQFKAMNARVEELGRGALFEPPAAPALAIEAAAAGEQKSVEPEEEQVTPEIMAVIGAAAAAFLGKKVRVLSAKLLETPPEATSPWSQQGRVFVQASHNLRARG